MRFMLCLVAVIALLAFPALAQAPAPAPQAPKRLPLFRDLVQVEPPAGFRHVHEQGAFGRFIREYVPAGETVDAWSKMLTVQALGDPQQLGSMERYWSAFTGGLRNSCANLQIVPDGDQGRERRYRIDCTMRQGAPLPGAAAGVTREVGIYRLAMSPQAIYMAHYVQHGDDAALAQEATREAIYADATKALDNVAICDLPGPRGCRGVDLFADGDKPLPLDGPSPCVKGGCMPTAILAASPVTDSSSSVENLLTLRLGEHDLGDTETLGKVLVNASNKLAAGNKVKVLVALKAPGIAPTPEERVEVGTFLNAMRTVLIARKMANPDSVDITLFNFR